MVAFAWSSWHMLGYASSLARPNVRHTSSTIKPGLAMGQAQLNRILATVVRRLLAMVPLGESTEHEAMLERYRQIVGFDANLGSKSYEQRPISSCTSSSSRSSDYNCSCNGITAHSSDCMEA